MVMSQTRGSAQHVGRVSHRELDISRDPESSPTGSANPLLQALDLIGCGAIVRNKFGVVIEFNETARSLIDPRAARSLSASLDDGFVRDAIRRMITPGVDRLPTGCPSWIAINGHGDRPLAFYQFADPASDESTITIIVDLNAPFQPKVPTLQRMFGLTCAEARLALGLAKGYSPSELARRQGVSRTTVRCRSIYLI
jgi:hypothetical protein